MKSVKKSTYEKGQAIVLIAAMMVGMIAMVGLAVDGGGLYFLDRDLQNAVDAAVVATVYAKCAGGDITSIRNAGFQAAADNGFEIGDDRTLSIEIDNPPTGVTVPPGTDPGAYISVRIRAKKDPYFIQVVYGGDLEVEASGVGYCKESTVNTSGKALFAACEGPADGIEIQASGGVGSCGADIVGGIHSNACADSNQGLCVEGDVSTSCEDPGLGGLANGEALPDAAETGVGERDYPFVWNLDDFDDDGSEYPMRIIGRWGNDNYKAISGDVSMNHDDVPLWMANEGLADPRNEPVLLYVNGNVRIKTGGNLSTVTNYYLTIVATGQIQVTGNQRNVTYVNAGEYPVDTNWSAGESDNGMDYLLFFSNMNQPNASCHATSGTSAVDMNGNDFLWRGIIFAPFGQVALSMSTSGTSYGAIWSQTIKYAVSGMELFFDTSWLPPDPPTGGIAD